MQLVTFKETVDGTVGTDRDPSPGSGSEALSQELPF